MMERELARMIAPGRDVRDARVRLRYATVQTFDDPTVTLRVGGSTVDVPGVKRLTSYVTPAPGDLVAVVQVGTDLLVIGAVAT